MKIINIAPRGGRCAVWRAGRMRPTILGRSPCVAAACTVAASETISERIHTCQGERGGEVREGNGTRMVFPGPHRRRAADEGYEICVGAASHMPGGQAQPCLL